MTNVLEPFLNNVKSMEKEIDRLKAENEKLKAELESTKKLLNTIDKIRIELLIENGNLKSKKDEYYLETLDYERANSILVNCLEEIKETLNNDELDLSDTCLIIQEKIKEVLK